MSFHSWAQTNSSGKAPRQHTRQLLTFFTKAGFMDICWSPNWNELQTASGTPRFGILTNPYPCRFGDPRSDMGSPFWVPFQFGDETLKSQIGTNPKLLLVSDWTIPKLIRGSPFWYGDVLIPISVWGSPNWFEDSLWFASPFRFGDPRFGLGISKPKWESPN